MLKNEITLFFIERAQIQPRMDTHLNTHTHTRTHARRHTQTPIVMAKGNVILQYWYQHDTVWN